MCFAHPTRLKFATWNARGVQASARRQGSERWTARQGVRVLLVKESKHNTAASERFWRAKALYFSMDVDQLRRAGIAERIRQTRAWAQERLSPLEHAGGDSDRFGDECGGARGGTSRRSHADNSGGSASRLRTAIGTCAAHSGDARHNIFLLMELEGRAPQKQRRHCIVLLGGDLNAKRRPGENGSGRTQARTGGVDDNRGRFVAFLQGTGMVAMNMWFAQPPAGKRTYRGLGAGWHAAR